MRETSAVVGCLAYLLDEFQTIGKKETSKPDRRKQCWKQPSAGILKMNSDGGYAATGNRQGRLGVCDSGDDQGDVVRAGAGIVGSC